METLWSPFVLAIFFGVIYGALPLVIHALYYRHKRVVACPRTGGLAEISLHGSAGSHRGQAIGTVDHCSLWPKVKGCDGECMRH